MSNDHITRLFMTNAIRVSPADKPFWYTSGMIGPFYINTHFIYGSEEKAVRLLEVIDGAVADKLACPGVIYRETFANYREDMIYKELIDEMVDFIHAAPRLAACDAVSGGERRDWFFSILAARILNKPHVTIYKDGVMVIADGEGGPASPVTSLKGMKVLHISDLVNEASSYSKTWIPAIRGAGGTLDDTLTVVDRDQGGAEHLAEHGVKLHSMARIDPGMFADAAEHGLITAEQLEMVKAYIADPKGSMRAFLLADPGFLSSALNSADPKTAARARVCAEQKLYGDLS